MNTGLRCCCCALAILTNQTVVGFPVIRITAINRSAMTGQELLCHADCFVKRMSVKTLEVLTPNGVA